PWRTPGPALTLRCHPERSEDLLHARHCIPLRGVIMRRPSKFASASIALSLSIGLAACGHDSATAPKPPLSQAEAQKVASGLFAEVSKALTNAAVSRPAAATRSIAAAAAPTYSSPCTNGGTLSGSYSYTDGLNLQGTGPVSGSVTITPNG